MQNQVPASNSSDQLNHMPEETMGRVNMPAPTAVPATMVIPAASEVFFFPACSVRGGVKGAGAWLRGAAVDSWNVTVLVASCIWICYG